MTKLRLPAALWTGPTAVSGILLLIAGGYNLAYTSDPGAYVVPAQALGALALGAATGAALGRVPGVDWFWSRPRGTPRYFRRRNYTGEYDLHFNGWLDGLLSILNHCWFLPGLLSPLIAPGHDSPALFAYVAAWCAFFWLPYWLLLIWRVNQPRWGYLATKD